MKTYADLEIGIHQLSVGKYTVEARYSPAGSEADIRIGEQEGLEIQFDFEALQKNAVALDMEAYGRLLTAVLFSPLQVKEFFVRAVSMSPCGFVFSLDLLQKFYIVFIGKL